MKTILLKAVCLLTFLSFTTMAKAQTKEETIAWISEKIGKYESVIGNSSYRVEVTVAPCKVIYKQFYSVVDGLPTKPVDGEKVYCSTTEFPTNPIRVESDAIYWKTKAVNYTDDLWKANRFYEHFYMLGFEREENLAERFFKALQHLNTFCEKKKETF